MGAIDNVGGVMEIPVELTWPEKGKKRDEDIGFFLHLLHNNIDNIYKIRMRKEDVDMKVDPATNQAKTIYRTLKVEIWISKEG